MVNHSGRTDVFRRRRHARQQHLQIQTRSKYPDMAHNHFRYFYNYDRMAALERVLRQPRRRKH